MNERALAVPGGSFFTALPVISLEKARGEIVRKGIHLLVALLPVIAAASREAALLLVCGGLLLYIALAALAGTGRAVPLFSRILRAASRAGGGAFELGPVTLGLGALLSLLVFPQEAAFIAIYALAFGDGFASLVGRILGRTRPRFLRGKSLEGSLSCFIAVYLSALAVSRSWTLSFCAALAATCVEALPLKDWDNIIIPLSAGYVAALFLR